MQFNFDSIHGLAILALLWSLFVVIFWMVTGWRAMRAHERIAQKLGQVPRKRRGES